MVEAMLFLLAALWGWLGGVQGQSTFCVIVNPSAANPTPVCSSCLAGTWYNMSSGACDPCSPGTFSSFNGATVCDICEAGTYQPLSGQTGCLDCSDHFIRPSNPSDTPTSSSMTACTECPLGYVSSGDHTTCTPCAKGRYQDNTTATTNECVRCQGNTVAVNLGSTICTDCLNGYFSDNYLACTPSPPGHYLNNPPPAATVVQPSLCPIGKYSTLSASTSCTHCPTGFIAPSSGTSSCTLCVNGTYADLTIAASVCLNCAPAKYSYAGATGCLSCQTGEVLDSQESYSCTRCPPGRYVNHSHPTEFNQCVGCLANTISGVGSTSCVSCGQGKVQLDHVRCRSCPKGYFAGTGANEENCVICPKGRYSAGDLYGDCIPASKGYYVDAEGADAQKPCGLGNITQYIGQSECEICPVGFAAIAGVQCGVCLAGYASDSTGASCSPCQKGTFAINGSSFCTECPPGYVQPEDAKTTCVACKAGYYQEDYGRSACVACVPGTYALDNATEVSFCPPGTFNNASLMSSCYSCEVQGPRAFNRDPAQTTCLTAKNGTQVFPDRTDEDPCVSGTYQYGSMPYCANCPAGRITTGSGKTSCVDCPLGKYAPIPGLDYCTDCRAGDFANTTGLSSCLTCSANSFSIPGQSRCEVCSPGYYIQAVTAVGSGASGACTPAPLGYYVPKPGALAPIDCPSGRYTAVEAMTFCTLCERGKYQPNTTSSSCEFVPPGFAAGQQGNSNPVACPRGRYTPDVGFSRCQYCQPGFVNMLSAQSECQACPEGKYSTVPTLANTNLGNLVCASCSGNTYAPGTNYSSCIDCPPGKIVDTPDRSSCTDCPAGYFRNDTNCSPCKEGEYTLSVQQWYILKEAEAAQALATTGTAIPVPPPPDDLLERCRRCEPGYYSVDQTYYVASTGSTEVIKICASCRGRTVQPRAGMARCARCEDGTYPDETRTTCLQCGAGKYLNPDETAVGDANCLLCTLGYYSPDGTLAQCLPCPAGTTQSEFSLRDQCDRCAPGTVKSSMGAGNCLPCGQSEVSNSNGTKCIKCDITTSIFDCSTRTLVIPPTGTWYGMALKDPFQLVEAGGGSTAAAPLYSCPRPGACMNQYNETLDANVTVCATGHTGVLCAICENGYALSSGDVCRPCEDPGGQFAKSMMLLFFGMLVALAFARRDTSNAGSKANFIAVAKVCLTYVQTLALLVTSLGKEAAVILRNIASTFSFTTGPINEAFSPLQCLVGWRFAETFYLIMAMPIIIFLWSYAVNFVLYVIRRALPSKYVQNKSTMELWEEWQHKSAQTSAILLTFLYINVVTYIWRAFDFYKPAINGQEYLRSDFRITKDSPAYATMRAVAWFAIALYVVAIPLALFLYLWHNQFRLETKWIKAAFKIIYDGYKYVGSRKWEERIAAMQLMAEQEEANRALQKAQMNAKRRAAALPLSVVPGLRKTFPALAHYGGLGSPLPTGKNPGATQGTLTTKSQAAASMFSFARGADLQKKPTKAANSANNDTSALVSQNEVAAAFLPSSAAGKGGKTAAAAATAGEASSKGSSNEAITLKIKASGSGAGPKASVVVPPAPPPGILQAPPVAPPSTGMTSAYQYHYELFGLSEFSYNYILQHYLGGLSYEFGKVRDANRRPVPPKVVGAMMRALKKKHGYQVFLEALQKDYERKIASGEIVTASNNSSATAKKKSTTEGSGKSARATKKAQAEAVAAQTIATAALSYGMGGDDDEEAGGGSAAGVGALGEDEMDDIAAAVAAMQQAVSEMGVSASNGGLNAAAATLAARDKRRKAVHARRAALGASSDVAELDDMSFGTSFQQLKNEEAMRRRVPDNLGSTAAAALPEESPLAAGSNNDNNSKALARVPPVTPSSKYMGDGSINPEGPLAAYVPKGASTNNAANPASAGSAQGAGKLRQLVVVRNHLPGYESSAVVKTYRDERLMAARGGNPVNSAASLSSSRPSSSRAQLVPEARYQFGDDAGWVIVGTYYWEILQIMRKVVVAFLAIMYAADAVMQALLGFLLFLLLSILHTSIAPYDEREVNLLEGMTLTALALTQLLSLVARVNDYQMATVWADGVSLAIFVLNGFVLVCLIGYVAVDAVRSFIVPRVKAWQETRAAKKAAKDLTNAQAQSKSNLGRSAKKDHGKEASKKDNRKQKKEKDNGKGASSSPSPTKKDKKKELEGTSSPGGVALTIRVPDSNFSPTPPLKSALKSPFGSYPALSPRGALESGGRGGSFVLPADGKKTVRIDTSANTVSTSLPSPSANPLKGTSLAKLPPRAPPPLHPALASLAAAGGPAKDKGIALSSVAENSPLRRPSSAPSALTSPRLSSVAIEVAASSGETPASSADGKAGASDKKKSIFGSGKKDKKKAAAAADGGSAGGGVSPTTSVADAATAAAAAAASEELTKAQLLSLAFPNFLDIYDWRGLAVTPGQVSEALKMVQSVNGGKAYLPPALLLTNGGSESASEANQSLRTASGKLVAKRSGFFPDSEPSPSPEEAVEDPAAGFMSSAAGIPAPLVLEDIGSRRKKKAASASRSTSPPAVPAAAASGATPSSAAGAPGVPSAADPSTGPMVMMLVKELKAWRKAVRRAEKDAAAALAASDSAGASTTALALPPAAAIPPVPKPRLRITRATFRAISEAQAAAGAAKQRERRIQRRLERKRLRREQRKAEAAREAAKRKERQQKKQQGESSDDSDTEDSKDYDSNDDDYTDDDDDDSFNSSDEDDEDDSVSVNSEESVHVFDEDPFAEPKMPASASTAIAKATAAAAAAVAAASRPLSASSSGLSSSDGSGATSPGSRSLSPSSVTLVKPGSAAAAEALITSTQKGVAPSNKSRVIRGSPSEDEDDDEEGDGGSMPSTGSLQSTSAPKPSFAFAPQPVSSKPPPASNAPSGVLRSMSVGVGPAAMTLLPSASSVANGKSASTASVPTAQAKPAPPAVKSAPSKAQVQQEESEEEESDEEEEPTSASEGEGTSATSEEEEDDSESDDDDDDAPPNKAQEKRTAAI